MATPEFIRLLREKVGTAMLWLPGVSAVVVDRGRVLLVRRADTGAWTPVTGICDPGEHPADTAVREVLEETGVDCVVDLLAWVDVTHVVEYPNGDRTQYVDHTFRCLYRSGEAHVADDESVDVRWFPFDALPAMDEVHAERVRTAASHTGPTRLSPAGAEHGATTLPARRR